MNIADVVRRNAFARPAEPAYFCDGEAFTWQQIDQRSDALATWLAERLPVGQRVGIVAQNCHRYWEVHFGCAKAGLIAVPINHRLIHDEIVAILADVGARGFVCDLSIAMSDARGEHLLDHFEFDAVLTFHGNHGTALAYEEVATGNGTPPGRAHPLNVIGYTSGTTGRTKGAILSHHCSIAAAMWFAALYGLRNDDVFLACMPAYVYRGGGGGLAHAIVGAPAVMLSFDAPLVLHAIEAYRVTHAILAPTMADRLVASVGKGQVNDLSSLESVWLGGAPSHTDTIGALGNVVGDVLGSVYGMTEATGIASMRWSLADDDISRRRLRSIGRPSCLVDVRLVAPDGRDAGLNQPGELLVRGQSVMDGYWGEAPDSAFREGWFPTGDIAARDADGYLYLVDRRSDIIVSGGLNVYSVEVESILLEHPKIVECSVVGAPDPQWGETVCVVAVVAPGSGLSMAELDDHCRNRLASYKRPRRLVVVKSLPRNAMGKVDKKQLRVQLWEGRRGIIAE